MTRTPKAFAGAPTLPRGRWFVEVIGAAAGYELYDAIQARTSGDTSQALRAGRAIYSAERTVHLDPERTFNTFATAHSWVAEVSGYFYGLAHVTITACVLVFLWTRRPAAYARLRTALVILSLLGLAVFWLAPVAPPRFAVGGLTDTLAVHDILGAAHLHKGLVNLYAAMPSLHLAWATWCAASIVLTSPHRRARHLAWLYPVVMASDVLMTANHYFFDILAGVVLTSLVLPWYRPRVEPESCGAAQPAFAPAVAPQPGATADPRPVLEPRAEAPLSRPPVPAAEVDA